ncbi:MAG: hypothetical protein ACJAQ3_003153 [Planctomycetota bacterium]|jgi:hypothetical protein
MTSARQYAHRPRAAFLAAAIGLALVSSSFSYAQDSKVAGDGKTSAPISAPIGAGQDIDAGQKKDAPPNVGGGTRPAARPPVNPKAGLEPLPGSAFFQFPVVRQGLQLNHVFRLSSTGQEPVIIWKASPSCGCLVGELTVRRPGEDAFTRYTLGEPIEPGSEVALEAEVATNAKQDVSDIKINVMTNTPAEVTQLRMVINVEPLLRATPPFLQLGNIPIGTERTGVINIQTTHGERVLLVQDPRRIPPPRKGVTIEFAPVNPGADGKSSRWRVDVRIAPDAEEGAGGHALSLISAVRMPESPKMDQLRAAAKARGRSLDPQSEFCNVSATFNYSVLGKVSAFPSAFVLGLVRPGAKVKKTVKISALDEGFDFDQMTYSLRGLNGAPLPWKDKFVRAVRPVAGENAIWVDLSLEDLAPGSKGPILGELVIQTGHPDKPEVIVKVTGLAQK